MTTKLADWASGHRQITKIRPSDASGGKHSNGGAIWVWSERIWRLSGKCRFKSVPDLLAFQSVSIEFTLNSTPHPKNLSFLVYGKKSAQTIPMGASGKSDWH